MKNPSKFLLVFALFSVFSFAQETLKFSYDEAGNQVKREIPVVGTTTGTLPPMPSEFKMYPNPTYGKFYIEWTEAYKGKVLQIVIAPISGTNMTIKQIGVNDLKVEFDITSQVAGIYPVAIWLKDGKTMFFTKIIKQ